MKNKKVWCVWHLNRNCNFNCHYCFAKKERVENSKPGRGAKVDIEAFKKNNIDWGVISMSGGEPFLYPNFIELCKGVTDFARIRVTTNLSAESVYDFADKINAKNVLEIDCSVHIGERKRDKYDDMIDKIIYLRKKGFHVFVKQVISPKIIDDYIETFDYFEGKGVLVSPKVMEGVWGLKEYPQGYSRKEREIILEYAKKSESQLSMMEEHKFSTMVYGRLGWKNKRCLAGYSSLQIQYNGDAYRCHGDNRYMGNLYKGDIVLDKKPKVCLANFCSCAIEGWLGHDIEGVAYRKTNYFKLAKKKVYGKLFFLKRYRK